MKNCENSYVNSDRVLFDSCSQLSCITSQLRNRLKLKTIGTRETFGNNYSESILEKLIYVHLLCKRNLCTAEQSK